jgi:hypothetical protein
LQAAELVDAQYFDAPVDAPFACPPPEETPTFAHLIQQIPYNCFQYTASATAGRAAAQCVDHEFRVVEGPADGPFTAVAGLEPTDVATFDSPRLAPEGDELFVRWWDATTSIGRILSYRRMPGHTFTLSHEIDVGRPTSEFISFGVPSRGPNRRMFIHEVAGEPLEEIELDSTGASIRIGTYSAADLGVDTVGTIVNLTADGLGAVFTSRIAGAHAIMYTARADLQQRFRPVTPLPPTGGLNDPFLDEGCGRLYFHAVASVLWLQRG